MRSRRLLQSSVRALLAQRTRSALAVSSVAVGVAAVLLAGALGEGAEAEVLRSIEDMGTNVLVVRPAQVRKQVARRQVRGLATSLVPDDCEAILGLALVEEAVPSISGTLRVKADGASLNATVVGTTTAFPDVRRFRLRAGRFFDEDDDRVARRVAVLGSRVAETLFPGEDPTGRVVRLRGVPFDIAGVFESKGVTADGSDEDKQVVIPLRTAQRRVFNVTWLDSVFVGVRDAGDMGRAQAEIDGLLRERHRRPDDFAVQDRTRFLSARRETAEFLGRLTTGLAAAALLVGGTGILALMLLSVKERTGEIGLRIAVGATPRDVFVQFLAEATALALGGWVLGAAIGGLGAAAVRATTGWSAPMSAQAVAASFAMAAVLGLGAGAVPARKASRLPPSQALSS